MQFFPPHSHLTPSFDVNPFEFVDELLLVAILESLGYRCVKTSWS